jgi:hypothetical protein
MPLNQMNTFLCSMHFTVVQRRSVSFGGTRVCWCACAIVCVCVAHGWSKLRTTWPFAVLCPVRAVARARQCGSPCVCRTLIVPARRGQSKKMNEWCRGVVEKCLSGNMEAFSESTFPSTVFARTKKQKVPLGGIEPPIFRV